MNKTVKWILIIILIIILIVAVYFLIKASQPQPVPNYNPPLGGPPQDNGFGAIISTVGGWLSTLWQTNAQKQCDPNRPGFQKDGTYNPDKCGMGVGFECDPNKPGYNMQGFPDTNCGFGG